MNRANVIKLLKLLNAQNVTPSEEWAKCSCLFAKFTHASGKDSNPSAGIHISPSGESGYSCFSCRKNFHTLEGMLGELSMLNIEHGYSNLDTNEAIKFLDGLQTDDYTCDSTWEWDDNPVKKDFNAFPSEWLGSFGMASNVPAAVAYLHSRKIPVKVWEDFDLRFDHSRQAIGFPYHRYGGGIAGMRGRIIDPLATKKHYDYSYQGKNNTGVTWFRESTLNPELPLIVVEGQFDCARVYQQYRNVTALLTAGASDKKLTQLEQFPLVIWFTDNDNAGLTSRKNAYKFFSKTLTPYVNLFVPDGFEDPCDVPDYMLKDLLKEHVDVDEFISYEGVDTSLVI